VAEEAARARRVVGLKAEMAAEVETAVEAERRRC
jgi:hypothetical protein